MSIRVDLLPEDIERRERARRNRALLALAGLVFVAILGGLYFLQVSRVNDAQERLEQAQRDRDDLQAEVNELSEFADLGQRLEQSNQLLTTTMGGEASFAGILQDAAAVMPNDAALTTLSVTLAEGEAQPAEVGEAQPTFGQITGSGETLEGHAPGVERFLLAFEKVAAFFNIFLSNSTIDEEGIATFQFEFDLGPEILTGRYDDGLPEALE